MFIRDLIFGKQRKNIKISHAELNSYVTEYLENGGKITKLNTAFCANPIGHEDFSRELEQHASEKREKPENDYNEHQTFS